MRTVLVVIAVLLVMGFLIALSPTVRAWIRSLWQRFIEPQPIVRLEVIRFAAPLAILGFMAARIAHPDDWLSSAGFRIPSLEDDWRQPASFAPVSPQVAWAICAGLVVTGLAVSLGLFTRWAAFLFAGLLAYVALADRMAAFTVSKMAPMIALALALSPAGTRYSLDALRRGTKGPELCGAGNVRFFQVLLPVFYFSSGIAKARGDWMSHPLVLWTHIHDSYQTGVSWFAANHLPSWMWTVMQGITLTFEVGAPLWFSLRWTRPFALAWGVAMHAAIGMMFGPVAYFAMLMITLLIASYAPITWLAPSFKIAEARLLRRSAR